MTIIAMSVFTHVYMKETIYLFFHTDNSNGGQCVQVFRYNSSSNCQSGGQDHLRSHFTADIDACAVTHGREQARNKSQSPGGWKSCQLLTMTPLDRPKCHINVDHG